jgi:hypothetical protein
MAMILRTLATIAIVAGLAATAAAGPWSISYSGRLTTSDGKPRSGATDLEVRFFDLATGGNQRGPTIDFDDVVLSQGVFQIKIELGPADENAVFGAPTASWIQIKDKTNNRTMPRQQFSAVPYALRVGPAAPGFDAFLKIDTDGTLSWEAGGGTTVAPDSVATSSIQDDAVTTDKILDGTVVDADITDLNAAKLTGTVDPALFSAYADLGAESKIGTGAAQVAAGDHNHAGVYAPAAHTHDNADITALDGGKISTGTVSTDRYSAYADLGAESKIGTGAAQVAAGDHAHTAADVGLGSVQNVNMLNGFSQNDAQWVATDEIRARDGDGLKIFNDGGNGLFVHDSGNVGIGTTSPGSMLEVRNDTSSPFVQSQSFGASTSAVLKTRNGNSNSFVEQHSYGSASPGTSFGLANANLNKIMANGDFAIGTSGGTSLTLGTANLARLTIDSPGNVGIGTASPASRLHIEDATVGGATTLTIKSLTPGGTLSETAAIDLLPANNGTAYSKIVGGREGSYSSAGTRDSFLSFHTANDETTSEKMRITASGNVGIGTTNPTAKLHVGGTAGTDGIRFPDGTLQTTAVAASNPRPTLRFSRSTVAFNALDATKDSTCSTDFGSGYVAAQGAEFFLWWEGRSPEQPFNLRNSALSWTTSGGNITTATNGSYVVGCIKTNAYLRASRTTVAHNAAAGTKDSTCVTDFGSGYGAATELEALMMPTVGVIEDSSSFEFNLRSSTASSFVLKATSLSATSGATRPVICIATN